MRIESLAQLDAEIVFMTLSLKPRGSVAYSAFRAKY